MTRLGQSLRKNQKDFDSNVEGKGASTVSEEDAVEEQLSQAAILALLVRCLR
jgi:hypothetical protein